MASRRSTFSAMIPGYDLEQWRSRIPVLATLIPMNNCSQAPQTTATRAAAERYLDSWNTRGMDWDEWMDEVRLAKRAFAALINADTDDIAVFSSVSEATSAVASAIDFTSNRGQVIATEAEFPTVGHVWLAQQRRGADVAWVPVREGRVDLTDYDLLLSPRTAIVSACHGYYLNGATQDLAALAARVHTAGALLYVDAYQTLGAMSVNVKTMDVDFLASGNLKYLMGVPGIAFLYVKPELVQRLHPTVTGWFGRSDPFAFAVKQLDWSATASRFDSGTPPIMNAYIARAGMEMLAEIGIERIRAWHEVLARRLIDGGKAHGLTLHGGTDVAQKTANTAFVVADSHAVEQAMRKRGVVASARGPVIRLAPHFYTSLEDVDTTLDALTHSLTHTVATA